MSLPFRIEKLNKSLYEVILSRRPRIQADLHFHDADMAKLEMFQTTAEVKFPIVSYPEESSSQRFHRVLSLGGLVLGAACNESLCDFDMHPHLNEAASGLEAVARKHFAMRACATACLIGTNAAAVSATRVEVQESSQIWHLQLPSLTDQFEDRLLKTCSATLQTTKLPNDKELAELAINFKEALSLP